MTPSEQSYLLVIMLILAALGFALAPLILAWVWSRFMKYPKPGQDKASTYECGLETSDDSWMPFRSDYYLYGIVFLVFDVEVIFLLPFAAVFNTLPPGAVIAMFIFLLLLVEGLVWAWRKGILTWR